MSEAWEAFSTALDAVIEFGVGMVNDTETLAARRVFYARVGEPFGDEWLDEPRNRAFLEWFVCDRPLQASARPPLSEILHRPASALPEQLVSQAERLRVNLVTLATVERAGPESLTVRRWANGEKIEVGVGSPAGIERNSLLMLRVFSVDGRRFASPATEVLPPDYRRPMQRTLKSTIREGDDEELWAAGLRLNLLRQRYSTASRDEILERWTMLNTEGRLAQAH